MILTKALKSNTRKYHQSIESHEWVQRLFSKKLSLRSYVQYLFRIQVVFEQVDFFLKSPDFPFEMATLLRSPKIYSDLIYLTQKERVFSVEQNSYGDYLMGLKKSNTPQWLAHFYVHYFGSLQGGVIIEKQIRKSFNLPDSGLNFYNFSTFLQVQPSGIVYLRKLLDSFVLSRKQQEQVIVEAKRAFKYTGRLMSESLYNSKKNNHFMANKAEV